MSLERRRRAAGPDGSREGSDEARVVEVGGLRVERVAGVERLGVAETDAGGGQDADSEEEEGKRRF